MAWSMAEKKLKDFWLKFELERILASDFLLVAFVLENSAVLTTLNKPQSLSKSLNQVNSLKSQHSINQMRINYAHEVNFS